MIDHAGFLHSVAQYVKDHPSVAAYVSDAVSDGLKTEAEKVAFAAGMSCRPASVQLADRNFCERCGKRLSDSEYIHICTPPADHTAEVGNMVQLLTDATILALAHRKASTYTHRSDPTSHAYGFVAHTLLDFARAIEAHIKAEKD